LRWAVLEGLEDEERRQLLAAARRRRFARREVLFHHGDPGDTVHLIAVGMVAVYIRTPLGNTVIFAVLGPGEAVGELALVSGAGDRTASAVALEPTETLSLRRDQFEELRRSHPRVDRMLVELLAARVRRLNGELVEAYFISADRRVLRRLLSLASQVPEAGGQRVIRLTQEDLAGLAGTSRATVNKTLRELERAGVVALRRGRIEVRGIDLLAARVP
jgi:CRP/FNR family transcriptional regulator, cyclic AMP receptor protein